MLIVLQAVVIVLALAFFAYVVHLIIRERLLLKYSLLWMVLTAVIVLCAVFPEPLYAISHLFVFVNPSNFIFLIGLFFLMAIALSHSAIASKQSIMIKNLVQEQALLEKRLRELESTNGDSDPTEQH